jgi:hypothetical protein
VESARFSLSFPLPDVGGWRVDDGAGRWLEATHPPSRSRLVARAWREGSVVRRAQCEAQARKWLPTLFGRDEEALGGRRPIEAPPGFESEVALRVTRRGDAWGGVVVVTAASVRRCIALAFATLEDGAGAESALAERMGLVEREVLSRVEVRTIDDRARRGARGPRSAPLDAVDGGGVQGRDVGPAIGPDRDPGEGAAR